MPLLSLLGAAFRARPAAGTMAPHFGKATPRHRGKYDCTGVWNAHHLVGDAIRLMLKRVIDPSDGELRLHDAWQRRSAEPGSRLRSVCPIRRKQRDLAEIRRDATRCLSGHHIPRG